MAWVYLDDKFHSNGKVLDMGNAAAGLYVRALAYCGDQLTNGWVRESWAKSAGKKSERERITMAGAWTPVVGGEVFVVCDRNRRRPDVKVTVPGAGYFIPDYLKLNPSKKEVEADRKLNADRQARWRETHRDDTGRFDSNASSNTSRNALHNGEVTPPPTPTPTPTPSISLVSLTRDVGPLEGALNNYALIVRLIAACGGGDTVREKVERTVRKWKPSEFDLSETIRAATGPGVQDALAVALSELKKRGEARAA